MGTEQLDYAVVLADMEAKRAALDATIASLRQFLAGQAPVTAPNGAGASTMPAGEVPAGAFLGKSIPDAATLYLKIMKRKATTREIADGLRRGGMESTSSNFYGIVHAILDRYRKSGGEIVKLDRSTWGLAEWYPAGVRTTVGEKRPKRKAKPKVKAKAASQAKPEQTQAVPKPVSETPSIESRIAQILSSDTEKVFSPQELAERLGAMAGTVNLALSRMAKKRLTEKAAGGYRAFSARVQEMPLAG